MKKPKRILAAAAAMAVCLSICTGTASASEKTQNSSASAVYLSEQTSLPGWIPTDYNSSAEFRNKYGKTHIEDGLLCTVLWKSSNTAYYSYEIRDNGSTYDYSGHILKNEDYQYEYSDIYEVTVYEIPPSEKLSLSWIRLNHNTEDGTVLSEINEGNFSFEASENGGITETDIYGWLPDSYDEFYSFREKNGNVSIQNGYIVFCDEVHQDGGFTVHCSQNGSGKADEIIDNNIGFAYPLPCEPIEGGNGHEVIVYKPSVPGTVEMNWSEAQAWNAEETRIEMADRIFEIGDDLSVRDISDDTVQKEIPYYDCFYYSSPEMLTKAIEEVLWKPDTLNPIEAKESGKNKGSFRNFISNINECGVYVPKIDGYKKIDYRTISLFAHDLYEKPGIYYCFDHSYGNSSFSYISIMYPGKELLSKADDAKTLMKLLNPNGSDSDVMYPACDYIIEKEIQLADRTVPAVIRKYESNEHYSLVHFLYDDILVIAACTWNAEGNLKNLSFDKLHLSVSIPAPDPVTVSGDANNDGVFNVADLIALNQWISGQYKLELSDITVIDMNGDGAVNVFDVCKMRRLLMDMGYDITAVNLSAEIKSDEVTGAEADDEFRLSQTRFALSLMQKEVKSDRNVLVSPYSVMQALAMTANGADGNTKAEMEKVLGGGMSIDSLNKYLYTQRVSQPLTDECKLSTANSIWARDNKDRIDVYPEFLQKNADYFGADFFKAPFDDTTVSDINYWVNKNTDGMIPEIINELDPETVMCLINAVAFDAKWEHQYEEDDVRKDNFTSFDGKVHKAEMMSSEEHYYLEDENASGFLKYYKGRRYAFAALLPDEGVSVADYIAGLTAESLNKTLSEPNRRVVVQAEMPKFSYDFDTELCRTLSGMGMPSAFDSSEADFTKIGKSSFDNMYIGKVIHKTHIDVAEDGTRAGAATVVAVKDNAVSIAPECKYVVLDRPFVYCIVDTETNLPVFIGTLMDIPE